MLFEKFDVLIQLGDHVLLLLKLSLKMWDLVVIVSSELPIGRAVALGAGHSGLGEIVAIE